MKDYIVTDISEDTFFSEPLYLDPQFIIATPEMVFSKELKAMLLEWEFKELYSDGEPKHESFSRNADIAKAGELLLAVESREQDAIVTYAEEFYLLFEHYTESLFTQVAEGHTLNFEAITENIQVVCDIIQKDRRFLLWVQKGHKQEENYQAAHGVMSMIISIIIGFVLKLPDQKILELGVAALFHEIGMMQLPPRVYLTKLTLTQEDRKVLRSHPILGYKLLKSFNFPPSVCLAALEHHERENSAGYPQKLSGPKISLYAKIIAVACSYEALTTHRPYKKAKDKHTGMVDLLKNEGKQYDDTIVRALLYAFSVYPIGLYVLLSNGKKGQVVDINPEDPRFPMVRILGLVTKEGKKISVKTSQTLSITRPLSNEEIPK